MFSLEAQELKIFDSTYLLLLEFIMLQAKIVSASDSIY